MNAAYDESLRVVDSYGRVWWQRHGQPGRGTLPTDTWLPGEVVADRAELLLDPGTPAGTFELEIALAQPEGGRRLQVIDADGRQRGSSLKLPAIRVGRPS
jgi:hypothetical protein